jgi:hypothetical protein
MGKSQQEKYLAITKSWQENYLEMEPSQASKSIIVELLKGWQVYYLVTVAIILQ